MLRPTLLLSLTAPVALGLAVAPQDGDVRRDESLAVFESAVRPLLIEHCVECHGGDAPKAGLRLDSTDGLRAGVDGEPLAIAGDVDGSLIVEALRYDDPFLAMPPDGALPDELVDAVERWVELGAALPDAYEVGADEGQRWCFRAPDSGVDATADATGLIDAHLARAMADAGVVPSPPADRGAWLRRVTYDLTGLPPTPAEQRAFAGDTAAGAEARVVDRLLASDAFGERWARRWLDLVRYAETRAHEYDYTILNAYRYRDYVIRAFDSDVPYDRFVTEFVAGDLLGAEAPRMDPTGAFDESPLGTGAWFLGEEVHSPVEPRGDETDRLAHQVEVLSKSVLALGVACARCHDHKFDPISAEDYHALTGFALSTGQRQLRYESDAANRAVAADLRALEDRSAGMVRAALAEALLAEADGLDSVLARALAAMEDATTPCEPYALEDARALDDASEAPLDLLVEDFEADAFDSCGLGPWEPGGDAFAERPLDQADAHPSQPTMRFQGGRGVNSYSGHDRGDRAKGTLTSAPFVPVRRYLHLLVNGGDQDATRVELLDAATGEVLADVHGARRNEFVPRRFDLEGREGEALRVRFVDDDSGGWGQIGGDAIVLSDDPTAAAIGRARSIAGLRGALGAPEAGPRVREWTRTLMALDAPGSGGQDVVGFLRGDADPAEVTAPLELTRVDFGELAGARWIPNGPAFGPAPRRPMDVTLDLDDGGGAALARLHDRSAAVAHPTWADLRPVEAQTRRGTHLNWIQAGRTIVSPTFTPATGELWHLVRGEGAALLAIASHRTVAPPLHASAVMRFDTEGEWRWVRQTVPSSAGLASRVEFTATAGPLEVARTAEFRRGTPDVAPSGLSGLARRSGDPPATAASRARFLAAAIADAGALLGADEAARGAVPPRDRQALLSIADALARAHAPARERVTDAISAVEGPLRDLEARRVLGSRLAPAALDLEGRDERVLDRGDWRSPGDAAPRRAPRALRASDAPLAGSGEGSGRLALARSLVDSPTAILQRVWVNRNWQWMFGRGIVATPDDFGAMGAEPTHPALLDDLATWFAASGWSTKELVRAICLSDAYRRSTAPTPSAAERDPANELLARMSVRRLEAEEIRDGLLAASGELDPTRFGPPVPLHLTEFMRGRGRPSESGPLDGRGRRSIYLAVRRNFPHPFLTAFDMPSPATCRGRRTSANVPAQALAMLNDPFVEGRAAAFAASLAPGDVDARTREVWLRALGRAPSAAELDAIRALAPETGADWADVCHTVFNLKEFVFLR